LNAEKKVHTHFGLEGVVPVEVARWYSPKSVDKYGVKTEMKKSKYKSKSFVCCF